MIFWLRSNFSSITGSFRAAQAPLMDLYIHFIVSQLKPDYNPNYFDEYVQLFKIAIYTQWRMAEALRVLKSLNRSRDAFRCSKP